MTTCSFVGTGCDTQRLNSTPVTMCSFVYTKVRSVHWFSIHLCSAQSFFSSLSVLHYSFSCSFHVLSCSIVTRAVEECPATLFVDGSGRVPWVPLHARDSFLQYLKLLWYICHFSLSWRFKNFWIILCFMSLPFKAFAAGWRRAP